MTRAYDVKQNAVTDADKTDSNGQFINDEASRYQMNLDAEKNYQAQMLLIKAKGVQDESEISRARISLGLQTMEGIYGGWAGVFKDALGEQSIFYKTAFAMQKAAALAEVLMNAPKTYSSTLASVSSIPWIGPTIAPAMAGAAVALQFAQAAQIKSTQLTGFSSGGYTGDGGKYAAAGIVHKGEVVFSQEDIARWGGVANVEKIRTGGVGSYSDGGVVGASANLIEGFSTNLKPAKDFNPSKQESGVTVNINVPAGYTAKESRDSNGNVTVDVVKQLINEKIDDIRNPNSHTSQVIQNAFGLSPSR